MKRIIYITALIVLYSCAASRNYTQDDVLISMEKTECYGPCPVYELIIYKNGFTELNAKKHLDMEGEFYTKLPKEKVKSLVTQFKEAGFFDMEGQYTSITKDLPTTWVYFSNEGRKKKIKDYDGAPDRLKDLEKELASLIESEDWKQ